MANLSLRNVRKSFGTVDVIRGVDLDIKSGEFIVFVGPSGCGKSTLLRMIAGLETITAGDLIIDNTRVNDHAASERGIAMVFQSYALYPHMSVFKNMSFGLETAKFPKDEIQKRVGKAAEILQITHLLDRKPKQLSGGQRQRVAIGRAIVRDPKIFLFDEPLSNLDAELRVQTRVEIAKLHADIGATMIYVTHDQVEAMTLADRIVVLRAGVIEQFGTPLEIYNAPANRFVAGFIGSPKMNFLDARISKVNVSSLSVEIAGQSREIYTSVPQEIQGGITMGLRPEHLRVDGTGDVLVGRLQIVHVEHLGGQTIAYGNLPDEQALTIVLDGQQWLKAGDSLDVSIASSNCHIFDAAGDRISNT